MIRKKIGGVYHHGDLNVSLKKAALRLVREKGPRDFSLNEASSLVGVTVAAPYRHFEDKDALLAQIARDGYELLAVEIQAPVNEAAGVRQKMIEAGMAYLRFAAHHSDYFTVMFQCGLEKAKYPELEQSGQAAFAIILNLSGQFEKRPELSLERAIAAWGLVHGLATLEAEGGLTMISRRANLEHLRPLLERFLG